MRVLFLTLYPDTAASPRYRVSQFLPYLRSRGIECSVASAVTAEEHARLTGPGRRGRAFWYHAAETPRRVKQLFSADLFDLVFVQKALLTAYLRGMPTLLRWRARRVVFDIDDAVHLAPPHPLRWPWRLLEDRGQVLRIMQSAHLVLAGNRWLASAVSEAGGRGVYFPTVVDTDRFRPAPAPATFRVGWIGGPSTTPHLARIAHVLANLPDAEVCAVGADPARLPLDGADVRPWRLESEVRDVQAFTIGVMPLPDDAWTRGKCALKALQYMACGVPCVASPVGAAKEIIRDGENGLFADSDDAWRAAFDRLRDPAERKRLGEAGRATVEEHYSLRKAAPRLLDCIGAVA